MKTVMKCLLTLALLIVGFSCEKSEPDPKLDYERRTLTLITEQLSLANQVRVLDNGTELYLEGDVASRPARCRTVAGCGSCPPW